MKSTIRLFKGLPIESMRRKNPSKELLEKTIKRGFIFAPTIVSNYSNYNELISLVEKEIGLTPEELNNSFHKSWRKIKDASREQLVAEQITHYFTTYGFESIGVYNEDSVYIPKEKLEIPELEEDIKLTVINGYTKKELKDKLLNLLKSGIALGEDTIEDVIDVAIFVELDEKDIETIKNKEVRVALYTHLDLLPENPTEFLRQIMYRLTEKTLLIKSAGVIREIKSNCSFAEVLFNKYQRKYGLEPLSEIFYRFKPLFLAMRENNRLKPTINRIRKLARNNHKPMKEDYLNSITGMIKNGVTIKKDKLEQELAKVNIFRKIRLAYALKFRTTECESILYKIRNGKGYATSFEFKNKNAAKRILDLVLDSITKDISKNVKGKKIYIPENMNYTLPATEKQFTGNFPSGTYISVPKDMIVGIHWNNVERHRIDLDLSLINEDNKIGWDEDYRSEDGSILFSGDMTTAGGTNGSTELFYIKRQKLGAHLMLVNYYNFEEEVEVPFKIVVAEEQVNRFKKNYMIDPNNVISVAKSKINQRQKILGLLVTTLNESRFYFTETNLGKDISSSGSEFVENSRKYLFDFYRKTISMNDILEKAGAKMVNKVEKCDIDLSPEVLEKDTILNLVTSN